MGFKTYITEAQDTFDDKKPCVIAPGRFNPPTKGHRRVVEKLIKLAEELDAEPVIVIIDSGKRNADNPLAADVRQQFLKKIVGKLPKVIVDKNAFAAVEQLGQQGLLPVGGVAGADRADSYKKMMGRVYDQSVADNYKSVVLNRDPDSDDDSGVSATKVREAARNNDVVKVRTMTGLTGEDADKLIALINGV